MYNQEQEYIKQLLDRRLHGKSGPTDETIRLYGILHVSGKGYVLCTHPFLTDIADLPEPVCDIVAAEMSSEGKEIYGANAICLTEGEACGRVYGMFWESSDLWDDYRKSPAYFESDAGELDYRFACNWEKPIAVIDMEEV